MPAPAVIRLTWPGFDEGVAAHRVAVLDLTRVEPTDGLQSGVRMRRNVHRAHAAASRGGRHGTVGVDEAPRAHQAARSLRESSAYGQRARPPERHLPGLENLDATGEA